MIKFNSISGQAEVILPMHGNQKRSPFKLQLSAGETSAVAGLLFVRVAVAESW